MGRQLGHEGQGIAKAFQGVTTWQGEAHTWGEGTGSIHYDDVVCTGSEDSLASCPAKHGSSNCGHVEDAGVDCGATAPTEAPTEAPAPGHGFGSGFGEGSGSGGAQPTPQPTEGAGTPPAWMNEIAADYPAAATAAANAAAQEAANTANYAEAALMHAEMVWMEAQDVVHAAISDAAMADGDLQISLHSTIDVLWNAAEASRADVVTAQEGAASAAHNAAAQAAAASAAEDAAVHAAAAAAQAMSGADMAIISAAHAAAAQA